MEIETIKNLTDKVKFALEAWPKTREDDAYLTYCVIYHYLPEEVIEKDGKRYVSTKAIQMVKEDNVKRIRAKFNAAGLYLPTNPEVIKKRSENQNKWKKFLQT